MIEPLEQAALRIVTDRLVLTPLSLSDQPAAERLLGDAEVMRYVADPLTPAEVAQFMADAVPRGAGGRIGLWMAQRRDGGAVVGQCLLTPIPIDTDDTDWTQVVPDAYPQGPVEIGYLLDRSAWGQGLATEICTALLRFAFEQTDLEQVVAVTDPDNHASQRVLQKCGMRACGPRRAYAHDGLPWFEMTRRDWLDLQGRRG